MRLVTIPGMVLLSVFLCWPAGAVEPVSFPAMTDIERASLFPSKQEIADGKSVAEAHCASCHGLDGLATDASPPHLAGQRTIYLYRELQAYQAGVRINESMRQAVNFLGDESLRKAAIYYAGLDSPLPAEPADESWLISDDPLSAVRAATAGCSSCHGETGNSRLPGMPSLTSQHPKYFVNAMKSYQGGDRVHNLMQTLSASLDERTINDMGVFYALQVPADRVMKTPVDPAEGRALTEPCAACHGVDGNAGADDSPSLAGQDPLYMGKTLKMYANGQRNHAPMVAAVAGFDDADFKKMAAYYASQKPIARRVRSPLSTLDWFQRCERCHGVDGISTDPRSASLAGQNASYLEQMLNAYSNGERGNSIMHAMSEPLNNRDIERLSTYYAARQNKAVIYVELPCKQSRDQ